MLATIAKIRSIRSQIILAPRPNRVAPHASTKAQIGWTTRRKRRVGTRMSAQAPKIIVAVAIGTSLSQIQCSIPNAILEGNVVKRRMV
jgi:hypothetical protein